MRHLSATDVHIAAKAHFAKPHLLTRDELIDLSKQIIEKYPEYTELDSSFIRAEDPFDSFLYVSLFSEAAFIEVTPKSFKVDFSKMVSEDNISVFTSALEFTQELFEDIEISSIDYTAYVHAIFSGDDDHKSFIQEQIVSSEIVSGGFIIIARGLDGGKNIRISAEQSLGYETGLFLSIETALHRKSNEDDIKLLRLQLDTVLKTKNLSLTISSGKSN